MEKILLTLGSLLVLLVILTGFLVTACSQQTKQQNFSISANDTVNKYQGNSLFIERIVDLYAIYSFEGSPISFYGVSASNKNIKNGYIYFHKNKLCGFTLYFDGKSMDSIEKELIEMPNASWSKEGVSMHKGPLNEVFLSDNNGNQAILGEESTAIINGEIIGSFSIRRNCGSDGKVDLNLKAPFKYRGI